MEKKWISQQWLSNETNKHTNKVKQVKVIEQLCPNGPEAGRETGWGSEFVPLKKKWSWKVYPAAQNFTNHMSFRNAHTFKTIWLLWKRYHLIHQSSIFSEISNNLQELLLMFLQLCCALVRDLGARKGPCQSSRNVLSISDLELYVAERSTDVCDPVTEGLWNPISSRLNGWTSLVHMCYQYKMKLDAMHPTLVGEDMIIITSIKILSRGWPAEQGKE